VFKEIMALKAVLEPILIKERRQLMTHDNMIALTGIMRLGSIFEIHFENGRPLSRAKAHVWREVDALNMILLNITGNMMIAVKPFTPAVDVICLNT
jgi:hypothetical protein